MKKLVLVVTALLLAVLPVVAQSSVSLELPDELVLVFRYENADAATVNIAGPFQGWDPEATPMEQVEPGIWEYRLDVTAADSITFKYVVDGEYLGSMEGLAPSTSEDGFGGKNGVVAVADMAAAGGADDDVFRTSLTFGSFTQFYSDTSIRTTSIAPGDDGDFLKGFEMDNSIFKAASYWKYTAGILPGIDSFIELKAFDGTITIFEQAPDASADPDNILDPAVTIEDGLENIAEALFGPFHTFNGDAQPELGHFKAGITTPFVEFSTGYKNAKSDESSRELMYETFDNGASANDGFFEIANGAEISEFGGLTLDVLLGLTKRAGGHGMYSWIDLGVAGFDISIAYNTLANRLDDDALRYYFFDARHTIGLGLDAADLVPDLLSLKVEALTTIDALETYDAADDIVAGLAGDLTLSDIFSSGFYAKYAGNGVVTLFGDDSTLDAGLFKAGISPVSKPIELLQVGANYDLEVDNEFAGDLEHDINPYLNVYLASVLGLDITVGGFSNLALVGSDFSFVDAGGTVSVKDVAILSEIGLGYTYKQDAADTGYFNVATGELIPVISTVYAGYDYTAEALDQGAAYLGTEIVGIAEAIEGINVDFGWKAQDVSMMAQADFVNDFAANLGAIVRLADGETSPFGVALGGNVTLNDAWKKGIAFLQMGYDFDPYGGINDGKIDFDEDSPNYLENVGGQGEAFVSFGITWNF